MFRSDRYPDPWILTGSTPPARIETERLVLRRWESADAEHFDVSLRANREHIGAWIPPVHDEPTDLDGIARRLERFRDEFDSGVSFVYAVFDSAETEVLGEAGLMPRLGPGALEIGYWVHVAHVGRGLATEATRALTIAGLSLPEVGRIEIHCDPANAPSAAVPRKLGYRPSTHSGPGDTLVFGLDSLEDLFAG